MSTGFYCVVGLDVLFSQPNHMIYVTIIMYYLIYRGFRTFHGI